MQLITIKDKISFRYSAIPSVILYSEPYKSKLSDRAKIAYMIILDRLKLSSKNNLANENGEIFVYLSHKELGELLHYTDKTITNIFKELVNMELIIEKSQGTGRPKKIFVNNVKEIFVPVGNFSIIGRKQWADTVG